MIILRLVFKLIGKIPRDLHVNRTGRAFRDRKTVENHQKISYCECDDGYEGNGLLDGECHQGILFYNFTESGSTSRVKLI